MSKTEKLIRNRLLNDRQLKYLMLLATSDRTDNGRDLDLGRMMRSLQARGLAKLQLNSGRFPDTWKITDRGSRWLAESNGNADVQPDNHLSAQR